MTWFIYFLGKKIDSKDKEKVERTDDTGPTSTPSQQQLASATPSNFVRCERFLIEEMCIIILYF